MSYIGDKYERLSVNDAIDRAVVTGTDTTMPEQRPAEWLAVRWSRGIHEPIDEVLQVGPIYLR